MPKLEHILNMLELMPGDRVLWPTSGPDGFQRLMAEIVLEARTTGVTLQVIVTGKVHKLSAHLASNLKLVARKAKPKTRKMV